MKALLWLLVACAICSCHGQSKPEAKIDFALVSVERGGPFFDKEEQLPDSVRNAKVDSDGYLIRYRKLSLGDPTVTDDETYRAVAVYIPSHFLDGRRNVTVGGREGVLAYEYSASLEGEKFYCFQRLTDGELRLVFHERKLAVRGTLTSPRISGPTNAICDESSFFIDESFDLR